MRNQYDNRTKYIDSGKRTQHLDTIYNQLLEHFDALKGYTLDEATDVVMASDWRPPSSGLYEKYEDKVLYLRGYFTSLIRQRYLLPA
jgi:hypothetical protein